MTEISDLCMWKEIELKDKEKNYEGIVTFSSDTKCAKCEGYNRACSGYVTKDD